MNNKLDDNLPKSLEEEFCYICQKIIAMLTYTQKNYTSLHNVLYRSLGLNITLRSDHMSYVISKVNYLNKTFLMVKSKYNHYVKKNVKKSDFFFKQNIEILKIIMSNIYQNIEELEDGLEQFKEKSINEPTVYTPSQKENIEEGTRWIITLFNIYLKYGGKQDVSSMEFFNSIKDFWYKLEDEETIEISYITDKILGGISIENISINLRNWLRINHNSLEIKYRYIVRLMA